MTSSASSSSSSSPQRSSTASRTASSTSSSQPSSWTTMPRLDAELARDVGRSPAISRGDHAAPTPLPVDRMRMRNPNTGLVRAQPVVTSWAREGHDRGRQPPTRARATAGRTLDRPVRRRHASAARPRHPRRARRPPARHRPGGDRRVAGLLRRRARRGRAAARPLPDAAPAAARPGAARRRTVADQHRLRQHHPHRPGAVVPRRRGGRARLPSLDPVERRDDGAPRAAAGDRRRRPHLVLRVVGHALRGRVQPLLPRQGPPRRRRPGLHPGPRLPRHLRPRLPRGPPVRGPAGRLPPGALARRSRAPGCRPTRTRG